MELVNDLIMHYGYIAVFFMLMLGIIGLPIPDEFVMVLIGYFTHIGTLSYTLSIIICFTGSLLGMVISYFIGKKAGRPIIDRFGKWIGLKEKRIVRVENWMGKYGSYSIIFGYFVPGIRHITCYFCGVSHMRLRSYILFAGIGAFLWCFIFITIGRFLG